ncbi:MAG: nucleotidyltransferase family protein [Hyphomicrobium sp.]|nr:nucleotidyltransferase family protein [Hyphomicrobium sp.]
MTPRHRPTSERPDTAMVLAAGLGSRMRPLTETTPKPLVPLAGRAMLDHVLDRLQAAGITRAIVNVHYLADQIERHVRGRSEPEIIISDERDALLETGGGVVRALPLLGSAPFVIHNSDSVWIEGATANMTRLLDAWDGDRMDALLLLAPAAGSLGYDGRGDFHLDRDGRIRRRAPGETADYVFAGVSIIKPEAFDGEAERAFSLNVIWDRIIASQRMSAIVLDGLWMHVGTPQALDDANAAIADAKARVL